MKIQLLCFLAFFISICVHVSSNELIPCSEKKYDNIQVTELHLKNGMRVYLKPTDYEADEILVQLTAPGGFSLYGTKSRASAELANTMVLDSGLGILNGDQLHGLLYAHSFEFTPHIKPFSRTIEGSVEEESLELFLQLTNWLFTKPHFEKTAFSKVLHETKLALRCRNYNPIAEFETSHLCLNTNHFPPLQPLTLEDLEGANFDISVSIFKKSYKNPAEFICVIVGNFKEEKVKKLVHSYLESIPEDVSKNKEFTPLFPLFPKGITAKPSLTDPSKEKLVHITFPVQIELNAQNMHCLDVATQLLSNRLKSLLNNPFDESIGLDVGYEFPLYPASKPVWLVLKFCADSKKANEIRKLVLDELNRLQTTELPQSTIDAARAEQKAADALWMSDNESWLGSLTNYALWGWTPSQLSVQDDELPCLNPASVRTIFNTFFNKANYSFISR